MSGTVCVIQEVKIFEWKIDDFLQIKDIVSSPEFCFSDASWQINTCSNIQDISLCLFTMSLSKPSTVNMTLSLKTVDGKSDLEATDTRFINTQYVKFLARKIISRSDLIKRKSELLPSDALTVICTFKKSKSNVFNDNKFLGASAQIQGGKIMDRQFLDTSAQTGEITEHELLDASVQTSEITGIWKLQKHLHDISLSGDVSDVILKVGDQEFKSHRCILAARSPVFLAMMKNKMKENVTGVVDIEDVDPNTFSDFLHYLYTGNTEYITPENVSKLFTVADKYQVETLKENCLDYMLVNVSVENFCDVFMLSIQHDEEKLKETCLQYFGKHYLNVIQSCKWQSFCCENPIICNELHIKHAKLTNKNTST